MVPALTLALALLAACSTAAPPVSVFMRCPADCTAVFRRALATSGAHVVVHPPAGGGVATLGSATAPTKLVASGKDVVVELAPGLVLQGFLNNTFYPSTGAARARAAQRTRPGVCC